MKKLEEMSEDELLREWMWTLVEMALLLLAMLLIMIGSWWGIVVSALFVFTLLRPNRGGGL